MAALPHLAGGLGVLGRWSENATQAERNAVYEALFVILEGTLEDHYVTWREGDRFRILVTADLVLHGRMRAGRFDLVSIDWACDENDAAA